MKDSEQGLEIFQDITRIANSTLDLDETLNKIIEVIQSNLHIDACSIYIADDNNKHFNLKAAIGLPRDRSQFVQLELGKGVTGWVAEHHKTLALSDAQNDPRFIYFPEIEEEKFKAMLSVPIMVEEQCIGVINIHNVEQREYTNFSILMMEAIASQVSGCIRNAMLFSTSQMLLKEQTILYDISLAVQTSTQLEHGLWIILSGITMGEAGGFNRAMIFIINESTNTLRGFMGLGPDSSEDAFRIWTQWGKKKKNMLQWMVTEADKDEYKNSSFNKFVQELNFPIRPDENILVETVLQKSSFNVTDAGNHPLVNADFVQAIQTNAFATVPLIAHKEVLGVILVDNRFNNNPISEEQLRLLTRFATHAGWVIENSRLFTKLLEANRELLSTREQLVQSEKLAALGEISAEVTHEIKNPLVSIGGFARRLENKIKILSEKYENEKELGKIADYSNIIRSEVSRLEKLLTNILEYSKAGVLERTPCNINETIEEAVYLFKSGFSMKNITVHFRLEKDIPLLNLDKTQIKQVLINLFFNAMESMPSGGTLTISATPETYVGGQNVITLSIQDTGGGIPKDIYENIFNPFFTTKSSGTGLGLSISRKIIEMHGGTIRVENNIGHGVAVHLHLPLQNGLD
jgi:two-component system sensor histidine kinase HydH